MSSIFRCLKRFSTTFKIKKTAASLYSYWLKFLWDPNSCWPSAQIQYWLDAFNVVLPGLKIMTWNSDEPWIVLHVFLEVYFLFTSISSNLSTILCNAIYFRLMWILLVTLSAGDGIQWDIWSVISGITDCICHHIFVTGWPNNEFIPSKISLLSNKPFFSIFLIFIVIIFKFF